MGKLEYKKLRSIFDELGNAFYILDRSRFEDNYRMLLRTFRDEYTDTHIAYSYKTNYMPCLCRIIKDLGGYAEIVSDMEMCAARRIGVNHPKIYHNGPYKKEDCIKELLLHGGHVNIDALYEAEIIKSIATDNPGKMFEVGVRVSLDIGQETPSRFGFDAHNDDLKKVIEYLEEQENILVTGCHTHLPYRSLDSFEKRMDEIETIIQSGVFRHLKYVSVGGGYMGHVPKEFSGSFSYPAPEYEDYARVVAGRFKNIVKDIHGNISLIIEPGSALVADTMELVTRVISVKSVRNRTVATLSGSTYNMNPSVRGVNRPVSVFNGSKSADRANVDLVGYTCIEGDVLYSGYNGKIEQGDFVVFHNVGSYSVVMKPPFILPDIPIVELTGNGGYKVLKRAQNNNDIFDIYEDIV